MSRALGIFLLALSAVILLAVFLLPLPSDREQLAGALPIALLGLAIEAPIIRKRLGWKTIVGALVWGLGYVSSPEALSMMPPKVAAIVTAVGAILAAFGLRDAGAKTQLAAEVAASEAVVTRSVAVRASSRSPLQGQG